LQVPFRFSGLDVKWVATRTGITGISKHSSFPEDAAYFAGVFCRQFPPDESLADYVLSRSIPSRSRRRYGADARETGRLAAPGVVDPAKGEYAAFVPTIDGPRSKAELRMMFLWPRTSAIQSWSTIWSA
jgi:hypothetical protein